MAVFSIDTPPDFRFRSTLLSHGWIDLAPFGYDETYTRLHRTHRLANGRVLRFTALDAGPGTVKVDTGAAHLSPGEEAELRRAVQSILQLDLDLTPFYEALAEEERYQWVLQFGAGRLLRAPTVWENLVKTLLTTNTTWSMTRAMVRRLLVLGDPLAAEAEGSAGADILPPDGGSFEDSGRAFPLPQQVAAQSVEDLDAQVRAGYRTGYLHELATRIAEGELDVEAWGTGELSADELYRRITALNGFGPYAAGAVLKLLGKFDRLALDSAARAMFAREFAGGERVLDSAISAHYEPYGEWRGLIMWMDLMGPYLRDHA